MREFRRAVHAWPLSDVQPLVPTIEYHHPGGGSWVTLSEENVAEFDRLQWPPAPAPGRRAGRVSTLDL